MARRIGNTALDNIWIVVTVNKLSTSVRLLQIKPKNLKPNEYSYHFKISTNFSDWENRIVSFDLPKINPPQPITNYLEGREQEIGKSIEEKVTEALSK